MLCAVIGLFALFIKWFPNTGLGIIIYAPFTIIMQTGLAVAVSFFIIKEKYSQRYFFEIGFYLFCFLWLLGSFTQEMIPPPYVQILNWLIGATPSSL